MIGDALLPVYGVTSLRPACQTHIRRESSHVRAEPRSSRETTANKAREKAHRSFLFLRSSTRLAFWI